MRIGSRFKPNLLEIRSCLFNVNSTPFRPPRDSHQPKLFHIDNWLQRLARVGDQASNQVHSEIEW